MIGDKVNFWPNGIELTCSIRDGAVPFASTVVYEDKEGVTVAAYDHAGTFFAWAGCRRVDENDKLPATGIAYCR